MESKKIRQEKFKTFLKILVKFYFGSKGNMANEAIFGKLVVEKQIALSIVHSVFTCFDYSDLNAPYRKKDFEYIKWIGPEGVYFYEEVISRPEFEAIN